MVPMFFPPLFAKNETLDKYYEGMDGNLQECPTIPDTEKTFSIFRDSWEENNYIAKLNPTVFFIDTQLKTLYKHRSFDF